MTEAFYVGYKVFVTHFQRWNCDNYFKTVFKYIAVLNIVLEYCLKYMHFFTLNTDEKHVFVFVVACIVI